jgi:hypothetical protein
MTFAWLTIMVNLSKLTKMGYSNILVCSTKKQSLKKKKFSSHHVTLSHQEKNTFVGFDHTWPK